MHVPLVAAIDLQIIDEHGNSRQMVCHINMLENILHVIIWTIISIITLGLGYTFYFYKIWNYSLNNTTLD